MDWSNLDNVHISRRHSCPVCGKEHYIGRDEEQNAWECVARTAQHLYIAQCRYCGGLIEVYAREDERGKKNERGMD